MPVESSRREVVSRFACEKEIGAQGWPRAWVAKCKKKKAGEVGRKMTAGRRVVLKKQGRNNFHLWTGEVLGTDATFQKHALRQMGK